MKREFSDKQKEWLKEHDFIIFKSHAIKYMGCVSLEIVIEFNKDISICIFTEKKRLYSAKENVDYYINQLKSVYKLSDEFKKLEAKEKNV